MVGRGDPPIKARPVVRTSRTRRSPAAASTAPLYGTPTNICFYGLALPLLLLPVLAYRAGLRLAARIRRTHAGGGLGPMLSLGGSYFLHRGPHREPNGNCLLALRLQGPPLDEGALKKLVKERFVDAHAELRSALVKWGGYFFWREEPAFSIEEHVTVLAEGENLDSIRAAFLRSPLPKGKSPWHILVVTQGGTPEMGTHVWLKYHHSLADGRSLAQAFLACAEAEGAPDRRPPPKYCESKSEPAARPRRTLKQFRSGGRILVELVRDLVVRVPIPVPGHKQTRSFTDEVSAKERIYAWGGRGGEQRVSMELVRRVARSQTVSPTAVIYAALTGAVRAHFMRKYGAEGGVPEFLAFPYPVPPPRQHRRPGNRLSNVLCAITIRLPVGQSEPATRLRLVHETLCERKGSAEAALGVLACNCLSKVPYSLRPGGGLGTAAGTIWLGSSNGPGPVCPITLLGERVSGLHVGGAAFPYPFYTTFISYGGSLEWTCDADRREMNQKELERIASDIHTEFEALAQIKN